MKHKILKDSVYRELFCDMSLNLGWFLSRFDHSPAEFIKVTDAKTSVHGV